MRNVGAHVAVGRWSARFWFFGEGLTNTLVARRTLTFNSAPDHLSKLTKELGVINDMEMWRAGKTVRQLRPENQLESEAGEAVA